MSLGGSWEMPVRFEHGRNKQGAFKQQKVRCSPTEMGTFINFINRNQGFHPTKIGFPQRKMGSLPQVCRNRENGWPETAKPRKWPWSPQKSRKNMTQDGFDHSSSVTFGRFGKNTYLSHYCPVINRGNTKSPRRNSWKLNGELIAEQNFVDFPASHV